MPRPSSLRQTNFGFSSLGGPAASASSSSSARQTSALAARIEAKKAELEHLRQLRDVSDALATQMEGLGEKLGTLRDGTEAVACVMANWGNVLGAIRMASATVNPRGQEQQQAAKEQPQKREEEEEEEEKEEEEEEEEKVKDQAPRLPSTLVRIPTEKSPDDR